jgi:transposase
VKTDRRDSEKLSQLDRAGELTPVWVPDQEQEAMRDLTRAREDMTGLERITKQRLNAFLLRYGRINGSGKSRWTQAHFRWMEGLKCTYIEYVEPLVDRSIHIRSLSE